MIRRSHFVSFSAIPRSTVARSEVEKFSNIQNAWWNPKTNSGVGPLHKMNLIRTKFIADMVPLKSSNIEKFRPLTGYSCLDVGCGGGLLSESLARLGGKVVGIDPSGENIMIAEMHAKSDPLTRNILYQVGTAEEIERSGEQFDLVCALEVVEHVSDVSLFLKSLSALVRPGGYLVISTINRTMKSYAIAIIGAEVITRVLPYGTHDWNKFVTPRELMARMRTGGLKIKGTSGMTFNPLECSFQLSKGDLDTNYIICAQKPIP